MDNEIKKCICGQEMTLHDWENRWVCHRCGRFEYLEFPQTNADYIRKMSDWELAEFLGEWASKAHAWMQDSSGEVRSWLEETVGGDFYVEDER